MASAVVRRHLLWALRVRRGPQLDAVILPGRLLMVRHMLACATAPARGRCSELVLTSWPAPVVSSVGHAKGLPKDGV
jgi:hypothetical protein